MQSTHHKKELRMSVAAFKSTAVTTFIYSTCISPLTPLNDLGDHVQVLLGLLQLGRRDPNLTVCGNLLPGLVQHLTTTNKQTSKQTSKQDTRQQICKEGILIMKHQNTPPNDISSIPRYLVYSKISRLFQDISSIPRYLVYSKISRLFQDISSIPRYLVHTQSLQS